MDNKLKIHEVIVQIRGTDLETHEIKITKQNYKNGKVTLELCSCKKIAAGGMYDTENITDWN